MKLQRKLIKQANNTTDMYYKLLTNNHKFTNDEIKKYGLDCFERLGNESNTCRIYINDVEDI